MRTKLKSKFTETTRLSAAALVLLAASTAAMAGNGVADAIVHDEVIFEPLFDGTKQFSAVDADNPDTPVLTTTAPEYAIHTPGNDSGPNNSVVRTFDLYAVKANWSVNEQPATNVQMVFTLPSNSQWRPDNTGMFAGCDPTKSTITDGPGTDWDGNNEPVEKMGTKNVLTCVIGDVGEGAHGTISPIAALGLEADKIRLPVTVKFTSDQNPGGVFKELETPFTVSERPVADWVKYPGVKAPKEVVSSEGVKGYVMAFPIALRNLLLNEIPPKGSGELGTARVSMADHFYSSPAGTRLATADEVKASGLPGDPCGPYVLGGSLPPGEGSWKCEDALDQVAGLPYKDAAKRLIVENYPDINVADDENMNGTANEQKFVLTGQIVFFLPYEAVQDAIKASETDSVTYENAISGAWTAIDPAKPVESIVPVMVAGQPGGGGDLVGAFGETTTENDLNTGVFGSIVPIGGGNAKGSEYSHYAYFSRNLEEYAWPDYSAGTAFSADLNVAPFPGNPNLYPNGAAVAPTVWDGWGQVSRGQKVHMNYLLSTGDSTSSRNEPIHGCLAWDPVQVKLESFSEKILVKDPGSGSTRFDNYYRDPSNDMYDLRFGPANGGRISPNSRPRIFTMPDSYTSPSKDANGNPLPPKTQVIVEFAHTGKFQATVGKNEQTCNNEDADSRGWIDASDTAAVQREFATANGQFDADTVRLRTIGEWPWWSLFDIESAYPEYNAPQNTQMFLSVQGRIGTDLEINANGKPVRLHSARARGAWDPATAAPPGKTCSPPPPPQRDTLLDEAAAGQLPKGWCGFSYNASSEAPYDSTTITPENSVTSRLDPGSWSSGYGTDGNPPSGPALAPADNDSDLLTIVQAQPWVDKVNNDGILDVVDNGQYATFTITPSVIGSPSEALADVKLVDQLPPQYRFIRLDSPLSSPGAADTCTFPEVGSSGTITCQLSAPDPDNPGPLPVGLPGGWRDPTGMTITVQVVGGVSSPSRYQPLTNTATTSSTKAGVWTGTAFESGSLYAADQAHSDRANTYMPLPNDQGAIVKNVGGTEKCIKGPDGGTPPPGWGDRCTMIGFDDDASNLPTPDSEGNITYALNYRNEGNTKLTNLQFVDVFPWVGDGPPTEAPSESEFTGDGRSPASKFAAKVGFIGTSKISGVSDADGTPFDYQPMTYVTGSAPGGVSRDPITAWKTVTWCDQIGGTPVNAGVGDGVCPATAFEVTAAFIQAMPAATEEAEAVPLLPDQTLTMNLILDTEGAACPDLWTNTFGARADQMKLEIRSNDVSNMVNCPTPPTTTTTTTRPPTTTTTPPTTAAPSTSTTVQVQPPPVFDLALRKVLADNQPQMVQAIGDPVVWKITVFNQGQTYAKDVVVTDYLPSYLALNDPDWTLEGSQAKYKIPVTLAPGSSTTIEITTKLTATPPTENGSPTITNFAEICKQTPVDENGKVVVDSNGNVIKDVDSTPDCINGNDKLINDRIDLTPASGDEDDHDIEQVIMVPRKPPVTGADTRGLLMLGGVSIALGALMLGARGRRPQEASIR